MCGRRQHKGFTLVEMLVVIAVLLVLASITVVGLGRFSGPAKGKATLLTMGNLQGLQAAYEAEVRQGLPYDGGRESPHIVTEPGVRELGDNDPDKDKWGRYGEAVVETQRVLRKLLTVPASKQAYGRLPSNQQMLLIWVPGVGYLPGDEVKLQPADLKGWRCIKKPSDSSSFNASDWRQIDGPQTIPLDGWGNPILFVPKGGLLIRNRIDNKDLKAVIPSGQVRPFWASAGDDGKFRGLPLGNTESERSQGVLRGTEDNVYSFEN